ncbi:hypothetical protein ANTQUA_LOCUS3050 [Anthophora quadrimaculata]
MSNLNNRKMTHRNFEFSLKSLNFNIMLIIYLNTFLLKPKLKIIYMIHKTCWHTCTLHLYFSFGLSFSTPADHDLTERSAK